ncbi:MerR family transcriptional regulator [Herbiconiux solani]|uniref:MerR family transcriptional regulator n=1 Tax=Herbiconiux solani TaxID=661329 RepID=UPI0008270AD8|nr:TipAS antibiotic-recognition domain-containing protein [Herbiconiux solani]
MSTREWPISEIAGLTGVTSRTLRHYDAIGLIAPSRVGANGYRYYDEGALVRLQRVLLLRELGLGLPTIAELLERETDAPAALRRHLGRLRAEQELLGRRIAAVLSTIDTMEKEEPLMAEKMFDGFDHTRYREEVEERWGSEAYARSDDWWRGMSDTDRAAWTERSAALAEDWRAAASAGEDPAGPAGQELARRQAEWLAGIPGTPGSEAGAPTAEYLTGLGEMYVADPRFAANYGGVEGATFVRDALAAYARTLS